MGARLYHDNPLKTLAAYLLLLHDREIYCIHECNLSSYLHRYKPLQRPISGRIFIFDYVIRPRNINYIMYEWCGWCALIIIFIDNSLHHSAIEKPFHRPGFIFIVILCPIYITLYMSGSENVYTVIFHWKTLFQRPGYIFIVINYMRHYNVWVTRVHVDVVIIRWRLLPPTRMHIYYRIWSKI